MNDLTMFSDLESTNISGLSGKTVTTRELAEVLGVSVDTVTRAAKILDPSAVLHRVINGGKSKIFTEEQATLIKQEIQKHHNLESSKLTIL